MSDPGGIEVPASSDWPSVMGETWDATCNLRWLKNGDKATLQQLWIGRENNFGLMNKTEWRDIQVVEDNANAN